MNFKIKEKDFSSRLERLNSLEQIEQYLLSDEVTRALEPTYSEENKEKAIQRIQGIQRTLNQKKNLYSKILKELLKVTN